MNKISKIGYGTYALSGAYGANLSKTDKIKILNEAYNLGITFFDTANSYGHTENIIGKVFKSNREKVIISTKINQGIRLTTDNVVKACEKSLRNLQTDYLDIYLVHYHDYETPINYTLEGLEKLVSEGKIRFYGISHLPLEVIREYLNLGNIAVIFAEMNILSLFRYQELIKNFADNEFSIIGFSCATRGLITFEKSKFTANDIRSLDPLFKGERYQFALKLVNKLKPLVLENQLTITQLALLWVIYKKRVLSALIGPTKINHLRENAQVINKNVPKELIDEVDKIVYSEHKKLQKVIEKEIHLLLEKPLNDSLEQAVNDLIYVLEYAVEFNKIDYQKAMLIFKQIITAKKSPKLLINIKKLLNRFIL